MLKNKYVPPNYQRQNQKGCSLKVYRVQATSENRGDELGSCQDGVGIMTNNSDALSVKGKSLVSSSERMGPVTPSRLTLLRNPKLDFYVKYFD